MTSSISHIPNGAIPYTQHHQIRSPGFGEIRYDNTLTKLLPILSQYANSLANGETQNQVRFTQGKYITYTANKEPSSNPDFLFTGAAELSSTSETSYATTSDKLDTSFKNIFSRDAKVGDSVEFVIYNKSGNLFEIRVETEVGQISNDNLAYYLIYKTSSGWTFRVLNLRS